jgi:hypothetical protein
MASSTQMVIPICSSTHASQPPLMSRIKTEPGAKSITILGDDSDGSSPVQAMLVGLLHGILMCLMFQGQFQYSPRALFT